MRIVTIGAIELKPGRIEKEGLRAKHAKVDPA
jgi:hypothetical protein